jgi:hypothetical protein
VREVEKDGVGQEARDGSLPRRINLRTLEFVNVDCMIAEVFRFRREIAFIKSIH